MLFWEEVSTSGILRPPNVLETNAFSRPPRLRSTAEDVLGDLGVRQAIKSMPKNVKL